MFTPKEGWTNGRFPHTKLKLCHKGVLLQNLKGPPIRRSTVFQILIELSPAHTVRFWPRFGRLRQILKILKDSYNPRLKSVVFDRWFDMFTDSRLMAVAMKFHLRRNSGSVRRFGAQSCSVTTPTMNVKLSPFFKTSDEQN